LLNTIFRQTSTAVLLYLSMRYLLLIKP